MVDTGDGRDDSVFLYESFFLDWICSCLFYSQIHTACMKVLIKKVRCQ